jgi:hypothetical protein
MLLALALIATAMLPLTVGLLLDHGYAGVGQRTIFVLLYAWAVLTALRLARPRQDLEVDSRSRES